MLRAIPHVLQFPDNFGESLDARPANVKIDGLNAMIRAMRVKIHALNTKTHVTSVKLRVRPFETPNRHPSPHSASARILAKNVRLHGTG